MSKTHSLIFGAHMSIKGGLHKAIEQGQSIGCTAIQIFTKSNRQWHTKPLSQEDIQLFKSTLQQSSILSVVAHASYLINIGSDKKDIEQKSVNALITELQRCSELGINHLVVHPGSAGKNDSETCLMRVITNLNTIFEKTEKLTTSILLETMAGQGSSICHSFEEIAYIIKNIHNKKRIAVCLDTCHIFAAGYDFRTKTTYDTLWNTFDRIIGIDKIKTMHVNDSVKPLGSHIDRHAHIGKGKIDLEAFRLLFNDERFFDVPKILETPKKDLHEDKKNMDVIVSLLSTKTKKALKIKTI